MLLGEGETFPCDIFFFDGGWWLHIGFNLNIILKLFTTYGSSQIP